MSKKPKILYIDDERDILTLAESFFEDESLSIETSNSLGEALEKIRAETYDLIISDARMPTGSGWDLIQKIRDEKIFSGKFILVTGNLEQKNCRNNEAFDLVLFKPLCFQELVKHARLMLAEFK